MKIIIVLGLLFCFSVLCLAPVSDFSKTVIIIERACLRYNYNTSKAFALFYSEEEFKNITTFQESKCRHYYGTGQICYSTAKLKALHFNGKESDLKNHEVSIPLCVHYMKILTKKYHGDYEKVVAHYSGYVGYKSREGHYRKVKKLLQAVRECL